MVDTILCIDVGTTSLKTALLSDKCIVEAFSRQEFRPGEKSKIADEWFFALKNAVSDLMSQNPRAAIEAICVSGNGPTVVATYSEHGEEKNATLLWNEADETESKKRIDTKSLYIPRFLLFKDKFPEIWKNAEKIFSGPEYLIHKLTNSAVSILPEERFLPAYWSDDELLNCGFDSSEIKKIPPFVRMGAFAGKISAQTAIATGLLEGTFVFCGAPDFVVALLGTGTIFPGTACDRAGSSEGINFCTSKPIFGEGLRTLPSPIPGLWNVSSLIPNSGILKAENENLVLPEFRAAIEKLRDCARQNGEFFPPKIMMTGGQCKDKDWILKKEAAANIKIETPWCCDAELIGDLILTRVSLGDYDDYEEAAFCLCAPKKD